MKERESERANTCKSSDAKHMDIYQHPQPLLYGTTMKAHTSYTHIQKSLQPSIYNTEWILNCVESSQTEAYVIEVECTIKRNTQQRDREREGECRQRHNTEPPYEQSTKPLLETESSVYLRLVDVVITSCKQHNVYRSCDSISLLLQHSCIQSVKRNLIVCVQSKIHMY